MHKSKIKVSKTKDQFLARASVPLREGGGRAGDVKENAFD